MNLSKQLTADAVPRDFCNLQRYQSRQPSIYNNYFGINLIEAVEKLPALSRMPNETTEANLQETKTEAKGMPDHFESELQNKTMAYHHEIDRLNQDIEINQYQIGNIMLGRGAHSTVRLAKSKEGFFAIKILWFQKIRKKYFIKQKQLIEMVNAETNLLLRLKHPNIIGFKEAIYSQEKERMFIVLEYCSKGSLFTVLNNRITMEDELWHKEVRGYFKQMVDALSFIHAHNIVHRDIKPENMLINEEGKLKIIDFNISQSLKSDKIKVTNKFIGTKGYAAPELILNIEKQKMIEAKALDIWSLGISLLELLQRKHPFSVKTIEELHKYLNQQIPINDDYPQNLKRLLKGMLHRQNQKRITIEEVSKNSWVKGK